MAEPLVILQGSTLVIHPEDVVFIVHCVGRSITKNLQQSSTIEKLSHLRQTLKSCSLKEGAQKTYSFSDNSCRQLRHNGNTNRMEKYPSRYILPSSLHWTTPGDTLYSWSWWWVLFSLQVPMTWNKFRIAVLDIYTGWASLEITSYW